MGFGPDSHHWCLWLSGAGAVDGSPRQQLSKGKMRTWGWLSAVGMAFRCGGGLWWRCPATEETVSQDASLLRGWDQYYCVGKNSDFPWFVCLCISDPEQCGMEAGPAFTLPLPDPSATACSRLLPNDSCFTGSVFYRPPINVLIGHNS